MEKRLIIFLLLSVLILTGNMLVQVYMAPPRPEIAVEEDVAPADDPQKSDGTAEGAGPAEQLAGDDGSQEGSQEPAAAEAEPAAPSADSPRAATEEAVAALPPAVEIPEQWLSMGSFDPQSGSRLLVTLCNRGAAVERVELVERDRQGRLKYRDLMRSYGYLGLYCRDARGCLVKVVGAGTPAANAEPTDNVVAPSELAVPPGFVVGDMILGANGIDISSSADLEGFLSTTRPAQSVTFTVRREGLDTPLRLLCTLSQWPLQLIEPETPLMNQRVLGLSDTESVLRLATTADNGPKIPSFLLGLHALGTSSRKRGAEELESLGDDTPAESLRYTNWEVRESSDREIVFTKRLALGNSAEAGALEFVRRYQLGAAAAQDAAAAGDAPAAPAANPDAAYSMQMDIEVRNLAATQQTVSYVLDGPNGLPLEGWWYTSKIHPSWGTAGARDIVWRVPGNKHSLRSATQIQELAEEHKGDPAEAITSILTDTTSVEQRTLDYLGVDTLYFSAVMLAGTFADQQPFACQQAYTVPLGDFREASGRAARTLNTTYRLVSEAATLEPQESVTNEYLLFLGPKVPAVLESYQLSDLIEYGWFGRIAKPLSWLLHAFYSVVRNYGLAIVLLTVLVRGAMFPIGRKAARNAQIMQELAPELKKIKEKYKNDMEKQAQAQRELWRKHNFNPLSGCWLMFLQLPIFIGLYRCLSVDINLRQAPLIPGIEWCSNLAGPDMAWRWEAIMPAFLASEQGWLGPYLNILPIVTIFLFLWQQKMFTPPATDEQTQMQQKMMQYMMIFMGFLFFKVPAGLCVYFIASSLWGVGERKLLPKPSPPEPQATPPRKSWLERLRERAQKDSSPPDRARRKRRK